MTILTIVGIWFLLGTPLIYAVIKDEIQFRDVTVGDVLLLTLFSLISGPWGGMSAIWRLWNLSNLFEVVVFKRKVPKFVKDKEVD